MATLWAAYGRVISQPSVGLVVTAAVMIANIAIILSSRMWEAPLESDVGKLWINPASEVAANNKYVDDFGSVFAKTNLELYTLSPKDGSNAASPSFFTLWMTLNKRIFADTVIVVNGTAYTAYDVCVPRLGQSAYNFGCTTFNSIDYFRDGEFQNPQDASAQWLIDYKLAGYELINELLPLLANPATAPTAAVSIGTARGTSWGWAFQADLLMAATGVSASALPALGWFKAQCQDTKLFLCREKTSGTLPAPYNTPTIDTGVGKLYQDFEDLLSAPGVPMELKFSLGFSKAQLIFGAIRGQQATPSPSFTNCVDWTAANTQTDTFMNIMGVPLGVGGLRMSLASCGIDLTGTKCPGHLCGALTDNPDPYNLVTSSNFYMTIGAGSTCGQCVLAMQWWLGDFNRVSADGAMAVMASGSNLEPTAGQISALSAGPLFKYFPEPTLKFKNAAAKGYFNGAAVQSCNIAQPMYEALLTNTAVSGQPQIKVDECITVWANAKSMIVAGVAAVPDMATVSAKSAVIATLLASKGRDPIAQLDGFQSMPANGGVARARDVSWRTALKACALANPSGECLAALVSDTVSIVNRHLLRPKLSAQTTDTMVLGKLSTNANDLLTQLLKPAIFGGTVPPVSDVHGGKCECAAGVSGGSCTIKQDDLCDCGGSLSDGNCVSGMLTGCTGYITCAKYEAVSGLAGIVASLPTISPASKAQLAAVPKMFEIGAAFYLHPLQAAPLLSAECSRYFPCVDTEWTPDNDNASPTGITYIAPQTWANILSDASYVAASIGDLLGNTSFNTASMLAGGSAATMLVNPANAPTVISNVNIDAVHVFNGADLGNMLTPSTGCYFATNSILGCTSTLLSTPDWSTSTTQCPKTTFNMRISGIITTATIYHQFLCLAEYVASSAGGGNAFSRGAKGLALWPKGSVSTVKMAACSAGKSVPPASANNVNETACITSLAAYTVQAIESVIANPAPLTSGQVLNLYGDVTAAMPTATQVSNVGTLFTSTLAPFSAFTNGFLAAVWGGSTALRQAEINGFLAPQCANAKATVNPTIMYTQDCQVLFDNVLGAVSTNPAIMTPALANIGLAVAKYKAVGTFLGACKSTDIGNQLGGSDCWAQTDCKSDKTYNSLPLGSCNLAGSSPFTKIGALAAVFQTLTPQAVQSNLKKKTARLYRAMANAPLLAAYNATYGNITTFGFTDDHSVSLVVAEKIIKNWRLKLLDVVATFQKSGNNSAISNPDALTTDASSDVLETFSSGSSGNIVLGYALMVIYAQLTLINWSCNKTILLNSSRGMLGSLGVILVAFSVASGLGITLFMGLVWSSAATQIIPFIMLALGVSDVFVLIRTFPLYRDGQTAQEACALGLSVAGPSTFLVAVTNAAIFSVGILTGMPVVVVFAIQAAIISGTNYVTVNTVMPFLLALDYSRQGRGLMECAPCVSVGTAPQQDRKEGEEVDRNCLNSWYVPTYSSFWLSTPGKLLGVLIVIAFVIAGAVGVVSAKLGLTLAEVAPAGSAVASALLVRDKFFPFYTVTIFTGEADYSLQKTQQDIVSLWTEINNCPHIVKGSGTPWIQAMALWGLPSTPFYSQAGSNLDGSARVCNPSSTTTSGNCGEKFSCTVVLNDTSILLGKTPFFPKADFYRCLTNWINYDLTFDVLNPGIALVDPDAPKPTRVLKYTDVAHTKLPISSGTFIAKNLADNPDFVAVINETRTIADSYASTFNAFPYGTPVDYWDQYLTLREVIQNAVGYGLLICFLCTFVLLFVLAKSETAGPIKKFFIALWASALMTGIIAMSVFEVYGFMVWSNLSISAIPAISIIMMTGVAVEYTAYISISFINAPGNRTERAKHALDVMMAPTYDGAATMLLGTLLLAASPFTFIVKYFFYVWLLIIFFGLLNGTLALPVLFSLVGPPALTIKHGQTGGQIVGKE